MNSYNLTKGVAVTFTSDYCSFRKGDVTYMSQPIADKMVRLGVAVTETAEIKKVGRKRKKDVDK